MIFNRLFGRKAPANAGPAESEDSLALALLQSEWQCACCGEWHSGVMDLAADHPDPWRHGAGYEPNAALRTDRDFLSEDFCVLDGEHFLVRCVLELPVRGLEEPWGFGCWSSLSRENFDKYVEGFDDGVYADKGPWFGWLCNGFPPLLPAGEPLGVEVCPLEGRQRPRLIVIDDHPLATAQREGLRPEQLLQIFRAYGHGPTVQ